MRQTRQKSVYYWHPERGWSRDEEGATRRLRSGLRAQVSAAAENILEEGGDGGWRVVADQTNLSGAERGLIWFGWAGAVGGTRLVFLRGVRAIDEILSSTLLDGLSPRDHDGEPLEETILCGLRFALTPADAKVFGQRVRQAGGSVRQVSPENDEVARHKATIADSERTLRAAADWAKEAIAAAGRGVTLDLHRISEKNEHVWSAHQKARRAANSLEASLDAMHDQGRGPQERVVAERASVQALSQMDLCEEHFALYRGCEAEAIRILAQSGEGGDPHLAASGTSTGTIEALGVLCAQLTRSGQQARLEGGRLVVAIPGGEALIGPDEVALRRVSPEQG